MDIQSRKDVELLVNTFYKKVLVDPVIKHFFTEIVEISWEKHMPIMYDFWESVLLDNPVYKGNPMTKHIALDEKSPMEKIHFDRWEELWQETLDELFEGEKVVLAKQRAEQVKGLMMYKVQQARKGLFM
jgi:hemoglobin